MWDEQLGTRHYSEPVDPQKAKRCAAVRVGDLRPGSVSFDLLGGGLAVIAIACGSEHGWTFTLALDPPAFALQG